MKNLAKIMSCLPALLFWPAVASAEVHLYSDIPLIGTEEVAPLTDTDNFGTFTGIYDDETNTFYYGFSWSLESSATGAHFHGPADRGQNAGILIDLGPVSGQIGTTSGVTTLTEAEEVQLMDGLWYINVHSQNHASGAIRGQVKRLPPGATSTVYNAETGVLTIHAVTAPRLGVFELEMEAIEGRDPLSLEISVTPEVKDLDAYTPGSGSGESGDEGVNQYPY